MGMEEEQKLKLQLVQEMADAGGGLPAHRYILREQDRPNCAPPVASDVPIIDFRRLLSPDDDGELDKLSSALQTWGIFQLIGHDLSPSFLDEVQDVARKFFQLPFEVKEQYSNLKKGEFDFEGYGNDRVLREDQIIDWNDRLYLLVQPEHRRRLEYWPESPNSFREILNEFTIKTRKITDFLLLTMAKVLKLDENSFINKLDDSAQVFARFNYYPACTKPDLVHGLKPHSDGSAMTVVLPDKDVEGLQVLKDGNWSKVPIIPHALLVNMGNQMEIMSNGIFKSPVHRVVANSKERLSLAMFYAPESEKILEPADGLVDETRPQLYPKITTKDFLIAYMGRFAQGETTNIKWLRESTEN